MVTLLNSRRFSLPLKAVVLAAFFALPSLLLAQLSVNITPTHVKCNGGSNGAATATASGGVGPYTFAWSNGQSGATITNLVAGIYSVTVTASNGATASNSTTITQPAVLGVSAFGQSQICDVVPDGTAAAAPFGGTAPYTYLWSTGGTTAQILHLAAGTYTVTVTDANGCTTAASANVDFWNEGLWIMVMQSGAISCFGSNNGSVKATVMSGTAPYTYNWSNGVNITTSNADHTITNLGPGTYGVTVTDKNGCMHIPPPVTLSQPSQVQANGSSTSASCGNTGTATVNPSGGTPPYTVTWSNGSTNFTITNLAPGVYTATVKDANNCTASVNVTVGGGGSNLQLSANLVTPASCTTGGSASVNVLNGSGSYTYTWDNGQTTQTATGLSVGNHSVTVIDISTSCTGTATVNVTQTGAPTVTASVTQAATCKTGGSATANVSGGTTPYTYKWDNNQTTQTATNLSIGSHSVTVTDGGGCVVIASVTITAPTGPTVTATLISNATCTVGGSASASATGGSGGYVYIWDNGQTTSTATNLTAGNHSVTVTDSNGCAAAASVTIGQSQGPTAGATQTTPATCNTGGSASASGSGGTPPYTYKWDNNQTTQTATGLSVGNHNVTITDAAGCSAVASVNITKTPNPTVTATATAQATCKTGGTATAAGAGGTAPYTYAWSNGQNGPNATNLAAGNHTVTVTDAGGCTGTGSVTITGTPSPTVTITASSNANCSNPGSATAVAAGGAGPYTYKWSNNETTATATNLAQGAHSVTVTDANGCTASASVTIGFTNNGIKIGDFVWFDTDQDGFQHPTETNGVPNVTVMLIKPGNDNIFGTGDDVTVKTTTTNASGKYEFDCVTPGNYILMFSGIPAGHQYTEKDRVSNDCKDSDVKPNGKTDPFVIVAGQPDNFCFDAGIHVFCDNVTMAGTVAANQTICEGDTPAPLYNVMSAAGGSGGPIQYLWLQLVDQGPAGPQWVGIPGATSQDLVLPALYKTSYYMRCARRPGCVTFLESNIITITVKPAGSPGCGPFISNMTVTPASNHSFMIAFETNPEAVQYMYVVQHSTDSKNWKDIETIMGKHDDTKPNLYSFMHDQPALGKNFYRIKRMDALNNFAYSDPAEANMNLDKAQTVAIYPNPITNFLTVKNLVEFDTDVTVQISALDGKVLHTVKIPSGSLQKVNLDTEALPTGMYMARIRFGKSEVHTVKITKF